MEYDYLIKDIMDNKEFNKLKTERHHGTNRMIHSKRVSYISYKICKTLKLDYISTARAGLLHDFFIYEEDSTQWDRFKLIFTHPDHALEKSEKYFYLNEKEKNIINSHMFPINKNIPLYLESWIVSSVDKIIASYEFVESFITKNLYTPNVFLLLIINIFS